MQGASVLTLYAILIVAVVQDLKCMRISNRLIVVGLILSVAFGIFLGGMPRLTDILLNISFPVVVLYLLYLLGVLGAGDIKLFSVIGGFTNFKTLTSCMLTAFVVAAVLSVGKMLYNRNLGVSLFKGQLFVKEVLQGNISSYRKTRAEERNLIHFSVAILVGLVLVRGYGRLQ
jgi:prepilin peptidase CpaA